MCVWITQYISLYNEHADAKVGVRGGVAQGGGLVLTLAGTIENAKVKCIGSCAYPGWEN